MKHKTPTPTSTTTTTSRTVLKQQHHSDNKSLQTVPQTTTPTRLRLRASSKTKESPKTPPTPEIVNRVSTISSTRAKSVPPDMKNNSKAKRGIVVMNKVEEVESSHKGGGGGGGKEVEEAKVIVVTRPRRRRIEDDPDVKEKKELMEKLEVSENLIKSLQSEVKALKDELDKVKSLNIDLESQNMKLNQNLASAEAKIEAIGTSSKKEPIGEHQSPKFKDIQKLIADKLERSKVKKEANPEVIFVKASIQAPKPSQAIPEITSLGRKSPPSRCLFPPPPPPPPPIPSRPLAKLSNTQKPPPIVQLFHSIKNQDGMKDLKRPMNHHHHKPITNSAHNSIVGEIQNRSAHLLAIREDIQTKGEFINDLIKKVVDAAYVDIEDVLKFVDWLDGELSTLADERAVLKHFKWPEKKADAMREAAVEYRELKMLEQEISSYKDDPDIPCVASLKKMASLLDKSERSIQKLIILRNSVIRLYQTYNIPTAWMLDSGITSKIKQASMTLVKMYMKRLTMELKSNRNSDRESSQDSLLLQGVHFAYRAHQFAGGLDSETLCAFEEIRQRVPGHLVGSRELLACIASS
ncbi:protein CHUP1, chloroplastic isoform X2 [Trifolium pratense]|uniref:protein CHUP1, chloroplastic isoform X2 n=1 Tax=Trifolium pratense TaxID=57577 RepID=UPI001E6954BC|nr:protein CHUP1, chloroplastic isoform X2 [Trifolium pratense]XP_045813305.1 protein CHUP1, chloroplastic isoform X2 [Trifolium pratense]